MHMLIDFLCTAAEKNTKKKKKSKQQRLFKDLVFQNITTAFRETKSR